MSLTGGLIAFALRQVSESGGDALGKWITDRFTDHSAALPQAVERAHGRAWEAVGLALGGEGSWEWLKDRWRDADLKATRERVRAFLAATPTGLTAIDPAVTTSAFTEWQRLDKAKRFTLAGLHGADLARVTAGLIVASGPRRFRRRATLAIANTADALRVEAPSLAALLRLAPSCGVPLLASAFLFFLCREIQQDKELARSLTLDTMRLLGADTRRGFAELELALGDKLDAMGEKLGEMGKKLDALLEKHALNAAPTAPFQVSVTSERELAQLREVRDQMRTMPPGTVGANLWGKLGDAERAAGDFAEAQASHTAAAEVARAAQNRAAEAAARFKAFRDACEASHWAEALESLRQAVALDRAYEPFPFQRYEPLALLGVGGFGAVFLCRDKFARDEVAIKSLFENDLTRAIDDIFAEAHALDNLHHPGIIGIRDQAFADLDNERRPYFVLEYFAGQSLETVARLGPADLAEVTRRVAEAVQAAHAANILHRNLKPANVLAIRGESGWSMRVIDFGLAVRHAATRTTIAAARQTKRDKSFSDTFRYAAPEQRGDLRGGEVGRYSDVYSFGKLCVEMLFGHLEPGEEEWEDVPEPWRDRWRKLIGSCLRREVTGPRARHAGFDAVLAEIRGWEAKVVEPQAPKVETLPVVVPAAMQVVPPTPKGVPPIVVPSPKAVPQPTTPKEVPAATVAPLKPKEVPAPVVVPPTKAVPQPTPKNSPFTSSSLTRTPGDVLIVPEVDMKFAWIPPGSFKMGGTADNERPIREVTLTKGYFMGVVPVTQAQWCRVMGNDSQPSHFRGDDRPVENVSWRDCQAFLAELRKRIDKPVRLPTEAEWEYACRTGSGLTTNYYSGDDEEALGRVGWYEGNSDEQTHPVGQKEPNRWGLYDMHGNIWEWCQDWYDAATYRKEGNKDPQCRQLGVSRVLRGGSWANDPGSCRFSFRDWNDPAEHDDVFGFRVCYAPIAPLVETLTSPPAQLSVPVIQPRTAQQRAPQRLAISPDELAALFKIEIPAADAEQGRLIIRDWNDQTYRSDSDGSQVYFPSQAPKVETLPVVGPAALQVVPPTQKGAPPVVVPPPKAVPQPTTTKEVPAATVAPLKPKEVPPPVVVQSPEALPPSHCFTIPEWGSLPLDVVQPPKALPQPKVILPAPPLSTRTSGDVLTVPGVEMKFAWIPPGSFHMGGAVHEDEKPIREVTLSKGYFMGVVPVTQAQWCRVMGDDSRPSHFRGDDRPVENVSWRDCQAFLVELCKRIDKPFRLPTEAEWEYACRAGSGVITNFCNGGGKKALRRVGWYEGNSDGQTHPVGQKEPNSWGLYDMHGNVWEWCQDWHDTAYYQKADNKDPQGSPSGTHRVLRGGCWCDAPVACRAAFRNWSDPAEHDDVFGFRVCFAWTS